MAQNELAVDMESAAQQAIQESKTSSLVEQALDTEGPSPDLESTIDVGSDFWDEGADTDDARDVGAEKEDLDSADDEDVPLPDGEGIIKYKANGKDQTLNLNKVMTDAEAQSDLAKKLALVDGARKAFSDKNKYRTELKKIKAETQDMSKYKDSWEKLESIKDDHAEVYRVITGESWDDMIAREIEKRSIYENATDEDRQIMDYEERIRRMELKQQRETEQREKELRKAEELKYDADKTQLQTNLEKEFGQYEFSEDNPVEANRLRKMLWRSALGDIQEWRGQGYKLNDKMIRKAFRDNASALQSFYKTSVNKGTKEAVETQKAYASEKAAEAATKNYKTNSKLDELVGKDPLAIFSAFRRGRR